MDKLEEALKRYYLTLREHIEVWNDVKRDAKNTLSSLAVRMEQLQSASRLDLQRHILDELPDLKRKLCHKIRAALELDLASVIKCSDKLGLHHALLSRDMDAVERCSYSMNMACYTSVGHLAPPFNILVDYAQESYRFFHVVYSSMKFALRRINFNDISTSYALTEAFLKDWWPSKVDDALEISSYLIGFHF